jgi:arginyl-tRNA---protein transferase
MEFLKKERNTEVQLHGYYAGSCGYCKLSSCSVGYGMVSKHMRVADYEKLMLCGWRRSGTYFYKKCNFATVSRF